MDREGRNKERMRKFSLHFLILPPFPHSLISSYSLHFLILSSFSHSLSIISQPGCQDATICATLIDPRETNKNKCAVDAQADKGCQPCFNNWHHPKTLRKREGHICLQVDPFILSDLPQVTCVRSLTGQL